MRDLYVLRGFIISRMMNDDIFFDFLHDYVEAPE